MEARRHLVAPGAPNPEAWGGRLPPPHPRLTAFECQTLNRHCAYIALFNLSPAIQSAILRIRNPRLPGKNVPRPHPKAHAHFLHLPERPQGGCKQSGECQSQGPIVAGRVAWGTRWVWGPLCSNTTLVTEPPPHPTAPTALNWGLRLQFTREVQPREKQGVKRGLHPPPQGTAASTSNKTPGKVPVLGLQPATPVPPQAHRSVCGAKGPPWGARTHGKMRAVAAE